MTAAAYADEQMAKVRDDPQARLGLLRRLYDVPVEVDRGYLPYRRAATAFMRWQLRRGLLNPDSHAAPGSRWWRLLNESLLLDSSEASALAFGLPGKPRTVGAAATLDFIRKPSAGSWYRAHNLTIASAYLAHEHLARQETVIERFFINLVLARVLFAHAMVAAPRLALGWLAALSRPLGDPRLGMTAIFLSLSRVLPDSYPLTGDLTRYVEAEHSIGHLLDVGIILPRAEQLYGWSAEVLELPELNRLIAEGSPRYAWSHDEPDVWDPAPSRLARMARRLVPA
jgi:hypothetical protein